jgi:hypothetical protein
VANLTIKARHERGSAQSRTTIEVEGLSRFSPSQIVYEIIGPDAPAEEPNGNFAITAVLPTAMSLGGSVHFEGELDTDFLSAIEEYMAAWCRWRPDLFQPVTITANSEAPPSLPKTKCAIMAFSGGLDSTFALHAHRHHMLGRRGLDIQAAALVQGFDIPLDDMKAFDMARDHVKAILDSYGVRLNVVRTNWRKPFAVKWEMTHILGIAAILHLFHRQFGYAVFADDCPYDHQLAPWSSNAITNQMLGCTRFQVRSTGASWGRTEKATVVASNPVVLDHLRVCYEHPELGENCGECEKCIRTKLSFYAAGVASTPTLKSPVSIGDVRTKCSLNPNILIDYVDMLERGKWAPSDPIRAEVADLVRSFTAEAAEPNTPMTTQWRATSKRTMKRRPLIRAARNILNALNPFRGPPTI